MFDSQGSKAALDWTVAVALVRSEVAPEASASPRVAVVDVVMACEHAPIPWGLRMAIDWDAGMEPIDLERRALEVITQNLERLQVLCQVGIAERR